MAGGQALDLAAAGRKLDLAELELMHIHKTGALIRASVLLAAQSVVGLEAAKLAALDRYAKCVGLAFQIQDDIPGRGRRDRDLGQTGRSDSARNKPTYPACWGCSVPSSGPQNSGMRRYAP